MGGVLAICGEKPHAPEFWELAAFVDVHGPHKLSESGVSSKTLRQLYAVWAWQQAHRSDLDTRCSDEEPFKVFDLEDFRPWIETLNRILSGDEDLLTSGDKFREDGEILNSSSFIELESDVVVRVSNSFTNHLYNAPDGTVGKAVVALSTRTHGITVSLADPIEGFSVAEFLQDLFGPEAGGRNVIGGTPRGQFCKLYDLLRTATYLREKLASL
jgi:hypothetical protein